MDNAIVTKLNELINIKTNIKNTISDYGINMTNVKFLNYHNKIKEIKGYISSEFLSDLEYIGWTDDDITKLRLNAWWNPDETYSISYEEKLYYDEYKEDGLYANEVINSGYSDLLNLRIFPKIEYESSSIPFLFSGKSYIEALPSSTKVFSDMEETFKNCVNLKYSPDFITNLCTNFTSTFENCYSIKNISIDFSSAQYATKCFTECHNVKSINLISANTPLTSIEDLCMNCYNLTSLKTLDMNNVSDATDAFKNCLSLIELKLTNLNTNIDLSDSPYLSKDSLIFILEHAKNSNYTIKLSYITFETYFGETPDADLMNLKSTLTNVTVTR